MQGKIRKVVKEKLAEMGAGETAFAVEWPGELAHGDFAVNAAMAAAKKIGKSPKEIAEEIAGALRAALGADALSVTVAGPGFVNITLAPHLFSDTLSESIQKGEAWGRSDALKGEKVVVEYYQPNYFKQLHVGHLMNAIVGESLARLLEFSGAKVYRAAYYADIGPHIAKAIWGLQVLAIDPTTPEDLSKAYEYGAKEYKESAETKNAIDEINRKIYAGEDDAVQSLYKKGSQVSEKQIDALRMRLGLTFDKTFLESACGPVGKKLVEEHTGDIFEKSEGATIFPGEKYGLHTRVFLTSKGLPVYETKDVGLAQLKLDAFDANEFLIVVDVEQSEYFRVVLKAIELVFPELAGRVRHVVYGRLRLPTGRISSREGNIISANEILDELKEAVLPRSGDEETAENVAQAAMRYLVLRQSFGSNVVFDKAQALSFEGDSGPYLQYAYARAVSVIEKAARESVISSTAIGERNEAGELERLIYRFPDVIIRAESEHEPHHLVTYLTELSGVFNSWYAREQIVDPTDPTSPYKVALTTSFAQTMRNGLHLLGISAPEKM